MAKSKAPRPRAPELPKHVVAAQGESAKWLGDPRNHGPGVTSVERIDTHGAMVFLAGERAYKVKRAVKYPYMDFSTLALRHAACVREVALNRRTAPSLYLAAEPLVRRADGALAIGGPGEAIEWMVVMRRFDQANLGDRLARAGKLSAAMMADLADEIAALHEAAEPVAGQNAAAGKTGGGAAGLRAVIVENAAEMTARPDLFPDAPRLEAATLRALGQVVVLLDARLEGGLVRRCHGDLHLRNICVIEGRPVIFDCIEFNDAIACIDVLYDLAFLLMDLERRGLCAFANIVLNRYLQRRADIAGLAALPLFLSVRAAVRAKVSASMVASQTDAEVRNRLHDDARAYAAAAMAYLAPAPARLVAVGGLSGTGKTALSRALAPGLGAPPGALHLRSDVLRKSLADVGELTRLPSAAYTAQASQEVYDAMLDRARTALGAGRAVVLDAVYARPEERVAAENLAAELGVPFAGLWLEAPQKVQLQRVEHRRGDASDATAPVLRAQQDYDLGKIAWTRIDAARDLAAVAVAARHALKDAQASLE